MLGYEHHLRMGMLQNFFFETGGGEGYRMNPPDANTHLYSSYGFQRTVTPSVLPGSPSCYAAGFDYGIAPGPPSNLAEPAGYPILRTSEYPTHMAMTSSAITRGMVQTLHEPIPSSLSQNPGNLILIPRDDENLPSLNQTGMWTNFEMERIAETRAQAIYSQPNSFYTNAIPPIMYPDDNSSLVTNRRVGGQYFMSREAAERSQLNGTSNMTIPEEMRSFDPWGGMYVSENRFAASRPLQYGPRMQSLERNITVFHETEPYPMLPYMSGNAHNTAFMPPLPVATALEPQVLGAQSEPPYKAVKGGYQCTTCNTFIQREHDMHRHLTTTVRHGGKRFECQTCGMFYTRPTTLRDHVCVGL